MLYTINQLPRLCGSFFYFFYGTLIICLHMSFSLVKIRLHTAHQLPRLPGIALKVPVVGGVVAVGGFLPIIKSSYNSC